MSKIGKISISIPEKVKVALAGNILNIEGPMGKKSLNIDLETFNLDIKDGKEISILPKKLDQNSKRLWGMNRSLINNAVIGSNTGYEKILELVPENSQVEIRARVSAYILDQINSGDRKALMHYGKYYLDVLSDADYNKAYLFYSIASAFGEQGAKEKRDKVLDDMDNERIVEVQSQASVMFEKLRKSEQIEMLKD